MPVSLQAALDAVDRFPWRDWSDRLRRELEPVYQDALDDAGARAAGEANGEWRHDDPFVRRFSSRYMGERIVQLEETTREEVRQALRRVFEEEGGASLQELSDLVLDTVREQFEGYERWRADRIARTESGIAGNQGTALGYAQAGVQEVEIVDGVDDDICAEANGEIWTVEEWLNDPLGHPNCVRSAGPILPADEERRRRGWQVFTLDLDAEDLGLSCALAAHTIEGTPDPHGRRLDDEDDEHSRGRAA